MVKFILQPVIFDGVIYFLIALFGYLSTAFGSDEAAKYVTPIVLFWTKTIIGSLAAGTLAIKLYRSTTFAEYRQAKNGSYHEVAEEKTTNEKTISTNVGSSDAAVKQG